MGSNILHFQHDLQPLITGRQAIPFRKMETEKEWAAMCLPPSKNQQRGCQKNSMHEPLDFAALPTQED